MHVYIIIVGLLISVGLSALGKRMDYMYIVSYKFIYQTPEEFAYKYFHSSAGER